MYPYKHYSFCELCLLCHAVTVQHPNYKRMLSEHHLLKHMWLKYFGYLFKCYLNSCVKCECRYIYK
jgi:hypothetical protein